MNFDINEFKEKVYIHKTALIEEINGKETYRVRIEPKDGKKGVEPVRELWVDRETRLPERFVVLSTPAVKVDFGKNIINQGLENKDLIPQVPKDVFIDNRTINTSPSMQ